MIADERTTESIAHPRAAAPVAFSGQTVNAAGPISGGDFTFSGLTVSARDEDVVGVAEPYLAYLSELAATVGLIDPVAAYLRPLLGRWEELRAETDRLRHAAAVVQTASEQLSHGLGALDAGWSGRDADAFVGYVRDIVAAGADIEDALTALAIAMDELVTTLRLIVVDMVEILVDTAEVASQSAMLPIDGTSRARAQIEDGSRPAKGLFEAARDILESFGRLCDGVDAAGSSKRTIEIAHPYPRDRFKLHDAHVTSTPGGRSSGADSAEGTGPSSAQETQGRQTGSRDLAAEPGHDGHAGPIADATPSQTAPPSSAGTTVMPMVLGGIGMGRGGAGRRAPKTKSTTKSTDLFGDPGLVAPPVIGESESPAKQSPRP